MQSLILAGGLGTRMKEWTNNIPKSLIPVCGKPFISYQLEWLKKNGVNNILLSIGYLGEKIKNYVGNGEKWNLTVKYIEEGENLVGTGGALKLALESDYLEDMFFLTYGDSYLPIKLFDLWTYSKLRKEPVVMTVLKNNDKWDLSNVCFKDALIKRYAKGEITRPKEMVYIDYGIMVIKKEVKKYIPHYSKFDLSEIFIKLAYENNLSGFEVFERFFEIGSPNGLKELEEYICKLP